MHLARFLGNPAESEKGLFGCSWDSQGTGGGPITGPVAGLECCQLTGVPAPLPPLCFSSYQVCMGGGWRVEGDF